MVDEVRSFFIRRPSIASNVIDQFSSLLWKEGGFSSLWGKRTKSGASTGMGNYQQNSVGGSRHQNSVLTVSFKGVTRSQYCVYFYFSRQDENLDLFFEVECHTLIGVANVFLECLLHDVNHEYAAPIISQQGEVNEQPVDV